MTTNITVRVDAKIAKQAKIIAAKNDTSVSAMVSKWLASLAQHDFEYKKACKRHEKLMEKGMKLGTYGKPDWTREEIHERK